MTNEKPISPFLARTLYSNGDESSSDDDDVFLNSRLDVMSRNCDGMDDQLDYPNPNSTFLNFKMDDHSISSLFTPSPKGENAVIFSVYFCGKYYGEVGLFEPDISVLDWVGFKSYIFSSLNLESFDSYLISYCDEDGDKLPIESEEDYHEALKIAKYKANEEEKFLLYITRIGGGFPNSLRSLVSSSLRRVNSVGGSKSNISVQPLKKDVTTSTSFQSFGKRNSHSIELNSNEVSPSWVPVPPHIEELNSPQENYFGETHHSYDKTFYQCAVHPHKESIPRSYSAFQPTRVSNWNSNMPASQDTANAVNVPLWFSSYMKQFKEDFSLEVSSKIEERFDEAVGNLSATDVETKLRGLLTGYSSELQNKVLCCCRSPSGHCHKMAQSQSPPVSTSLSHQETIDRLSLERGTLVTPLSALRFDHNREDSLDGGDGPNNQDYFLQKLLKREQEILDFLDNTNEKIKQKIKVNNDYTDSLRNCLTKELAIEERERVLARIEDFRQRQSRTTNDIKMLQQSMEVNNEGIARLALQDFVPPKDYDAKFIKDESFADGSKVEPKQQFIKQWGIQNTGQKPWDLETFLVCQSYHHMKPTCQSIPCPPLLPGDMGIISAQFTAPSTPGIFSTEWRFIQRDKLFGNHLWCTIIVPAKSDIGTDPVLPCQPDAIEGAASVSEVPCLEELVRRQLFTDRSEVETPPVDFVPAKFDKGSIEYFSYISKDSICQMSSEDILYYLMYILRITKPDFTTLIDRLPLKILIKSLSRGTDQDYDNLSLFLDKNFVEKCNRDNFNAKDMEECYKELFLTAKDSENIHELNRKLQDRYLHNSFNYSVDDSSDEDVKDDTINGRETAPLVEEYYTEEAAADADDVEALCADKELPVMNGPDVKYESEQHSDEEYDNFKKLVVSEPFKYMPEVENEYVIEDVAIFGPEEQSLQDILELNHELAVDENEEMVENLHDESVEHPEGEGPYNLHELESVEDHEEVRKSEVDPENEKFCRVNEDDCEDECSSIYSEYSDSDSSLESEDEEENLQKEKPLESDIEVNSNVEEDRVSGEEEEDEEEEEVVVEESSIAEEEDAVDKQACSSSFQNSGEMRIEKDPKKNITYLREHFKQNVEVRLDFEVIRQPMTETSRLLGNSSSTQADALTFQEKHFMVSSRPPPDTVQVPESDDESFDGLVFINDTDIPSSVPPTEPCSPSNPLPPHLSNPPVLNEYERTMSCSSFSEVEDEEQEDPEGVPDTADSSIHESVSTDVCSESSSSPVVDEASSVYYESSLPEDVLEQFYSVRSEEKKDDACLKSPDANADSGSSTSHTLKDLPASESSGSYDVNEAPLVDLAQEESASEFEYVANVDN